MAHVAGSESVVVKWINPLKRPATQNDETPLCSLSNTFYTLIFLLNRYRLHKSTLISSINRRRLL
jgi:hypothetical protein